MYAGMALRNRGGSEMLDHRAPQPIPARAGSVVFLTENDRSARRAGVVEGVSSIHHRGDRKPAAPRVIRDGGQSFEPSRRALSAFFVAIATIALSLPRS